MNLNQECKAGKLGKEVESKQGKLKERFDELLVKEFFLEKRG